MTSKNVQRKFEPIIVAGLTENSPLFSYCVLVQVPKVLKEMVLIYEKGAKTAKRNSTVMYTAISVDLVQNILECHFIQCCGTGVTSTLSIRNQLNPIF